MKSFQHVETPLRIFAGPDCLRNLERELARLGAARAVIFCGTTLSRDPLIDELRAGAGSRCAGIFAGVRAHTPRSAVVEAADALKRLDADAVIAVGGGSAAVSARAASIFLAESYDLDAMCTRRDERTGRMVSPRLDRPKIPQLIVPTTPNTAFVKAGTAVFDTEAGQRRAMFDPKTRSQSVFLHPGFLMSAPRDLVVSASLDSLALALEGLISTAGDAISDALLMQAVRLLTEGMPRLTTGDDDQLRADLAMAAILAGRGTDHAGAGLATALGHSIGAVHHVASGTAKSVILPHVMRYNLDHIGPGLTRLAVALSLPPAPDVDAIGAALGRVYRTLGLPARLRDLDIPQEALPAIAERSMADFFVSTNPRPVAGPADLLGILTQAW